MDITLRKVTVADLVRGYTDDGDGGVRGYSGRLDIRPPFQREFVYKARQQAAVLDTIRSGFPLNTMYWATRNDGTFEIIDGQQRTVSVARYVAGDFSHRDRYFDNLTSDERDQIRKYALMVYVCEGTDSEKLRWYETINIAGEKLTKQELRNAVYAGPWLSDAKRYFSRPGCGAYEIGKDYVRGAAIRQDFLETAISWISIGKIEKYMARNQHNPTADELWGHFLLVTSWVKAKFPTTRPQMRGVDWGALHREFKGAPLDPSVLEAETVKLLSDDDVTRKPGIYPYLLTRDERHFNIRAFTAAMRQKVYERQRGKCALCDGPFEIGAMEGDHIKPWAEGGRTLEENCQMLCKDCNRRKSAK